MGLSIALMLLKYLKKWKPYTFKIDLSYNNVAQYFFTSDPKKDSVWLL